MHEIDRVLFFNKVIPKFETRNENKKKQSNLLLLDLKFLKLDQLSKRVIDDWNSQKRVTFFLFPFISKN